MFAEGTVAVVEVGKGRCRRDAIVTRPTRLVHEVPTVGCCVGVRRWGRLSGIRTLEEFIAWRAAGDSGV